MSKKPTDLAVLIKKYFRDYLILQKNVSNNTIKAYRDSLKFLLNFLSKSCNIKIEKLEVQHLTCENIQSFLNWLEIDKNTSIATRNARLAAIHSFVRYSQSECLENISDFQRIIAIPFKKDVKSTVNYLTKDQISLLLSVIDKTKSRGRRDLALLSLLYDTGARVQEIIDLTVSNFTEYTTPVMRILGKGRKERLVPISKTVFNIVKSYIKEFHLDIQLRQDWPLFHNSQRNKLTRSGVSYIIKKYADKARSLDKTFPSDAHPHILRHSRAVHLVEAGVNILAIKEMLGHSDVKTTQIYAKVDLIRKRETLETAYTPAPELNELGDWNDQPDIMGFLENLG